MGRRQEELCVCMPAGFKDTTTFNTLCSVLPIALPCSFPPSLLNQWRRHSLEPRDGAGKKLAVMQQLWKPWRRASCLRPGF